VNDAAGGSQVGNAAGSKVSGWGNNAVVRRQKSRHRDVGGSTARAAVLGAGDGLLTNVSLVLGVAGANPGAGAVRLAGIAGLLAGAFSMAAGELVSVRAQDELAQREVEVERSELEEDSQTEQRELTGMLRVRGLPPEEAATVSRIISAYPAAALDAHVRLELGIDPDRTGSATRAAVASFFSFASGAVLPLLPWFFISGTDAIVASIAIGVVAALALGGTIGAFTGRGVARTAFRQLVAATVAAAITFGIGHLLGTQSG
jgi:vacuolar iron transporter family protein